MYHDDLSVYSCGTHSFGFARRVGWIDAKHHYPVGIVPNELFEKLHWIVANQTETFDAHVNDMRCIRRCFSCLKEICTWSKTGEQVVLGKSEIWIPGAEYWYVCPSLITHYVNQHQYLPPIEFVDTILQFDISKPFNAQDGYQALMDEYVREHGPFC